SSDTNIQSVFYNLLSSLGINNVDGRFFFSIVVTLVMSSMILAFKGGLGGFFAVGVLSITVFSFVGWLPTWLFLTVAVLAVMFVTFKAFSKIGGGDGGE